MDPNTRIDEALLLRYFDGEVTQDEKQKVERWIASSEENKKLKFRI